MRTTISASNTKFRKNSFVGSTDYLSQLSTCIEAVKWLVHEISSKFGTGSSDSHQIAFAFFWMTHIARVLYCYLTVWPLSSCMRKQDNVENFTRKLNVSFHLLFQLMRPDLWSGQNLWLSPIERGKSTLKNLLATKKLWESYCINAMTSVAWLPYPLLTFFFLKMSQPGRHKGTVKY